MSTILYFMLNPKNECDRTTRENVEVSKRVVVVIKGSDRSVLGILIKCDNDNGIQALDHDMASFKSCF